MGGGVLRMASCDQLSDGLDAQDVGERSHDLHCDEPVHDLNVPFQDLCHGWNIV